MPPRWDDAKYVRVWTGGGVLVVLVVVVLTVASRVEQLRDPTVCDANDLVDPVRNNQSSSDGALTYATCRLGWT